MSILKIYFWEDLGMIFIKILYAIVALVTLTGWGLMIFATIKEWRNIGKFKGLCTFLFVSFIAVLGISLFFSDYPF